jgi:branched-chain amino acid transport system permease protein
LLAQIIVSGIAMGCIYALVAIGFVIIYKSTEIVNFAHGDLLMLGAFVGYSFIEVAGANYWLGLGLTAAVMFCVGWVMDAAILRRMIGMPQFSVIMLTVGIGFVLRTLVSVTPGWGVETKTIGSPFAGKMITLGGVPISMENLSIIVSTLLVCAALTLFFSRTRLGTVTKAASQNQIAAYTLGLPVTSIYSLVVGIGAALAGIGGVLVAPILYIEPNMGFSVMVAYATAILGGLGSLPGALLGGIVIGVVEQLAGYYGTESVKHVAPYVLLLVVLVIRPEGFAGLHVTKKV